MAIAVIIPMHTWKKDEDYYLGLFLNRRLIKM